MDDMQLLQEKMLGLRTSMEEAIMQAAFAGCTMIVEPDRKDVPGFYPPKADEASGGIVFFTQENITLKGTKNFVRIPLGVKVKVFGNSQLILTAYQDEGALSGMIPKVITPFSADVPLYANFILENSESAVLNIQAGQPLIVATAVQQMPIFMMLNSENYKPINESTGDASVSN